MVPPALLMPPSLCESYATQVIFMCLLSMKTVCLTCMYMYEHHLN